MSLHNTAESFTADFPEVSMLREAVYTAKRDYRCAVCGVIIPRGSRYRYFAYTDNDVLGSANKFRASRLHLFCPPKE